MLGDCYLTRRPLVFRRKTRWYSIAHKLEIPRRRPNRLVVAISLLFLPAFYGCRQIPDPPTAQEINKVLASERCMQPGACADNPGPFDPALDIYLDDSGSMRGFATRPESNYLRVLQGTLLAATAAPFDLSVYPLSSKSPVPPAPMNQFSKASFYEKPDTPLVDLVSRIAQKPDHTAIVISDLVQSERQQNQDIQALIRVLRQLVEMRSEIRLFAFRSDFVGDYYPESESRDCRKIHCGHESKRSRSRQALLSACDRAQQHDDGETLRLHREPALSSQFLRSRSSCV